MPSRKSYDALIVGSGPAGITAASSLMDAGLTDICIVESVNAGGRIASSYREVPSNTKTGLFAQWATGTRTFAGLIASAPAPNPYTRLLQLDQNKTCMLDDAIGVALMLHQGITALPGVDYVEDRVTHLCHSGDAWHFGGSDGLRGAARKVVLAQGAHPTPTAGDYFSGQEVSIETALRPSQLASSIPAGSKVAVIGASHSAVLAMKNLCELGKDITVVNFYRHPLIYAEYKDGWILYDNTGLKGVAAEWARAVLEPETDPRVRRVCLRDGERTEPEIYEAEMSGCTHYVTATGYRRNPPPRVNVGREDVELDFDPLTGRFRNAPGIYGIGIAYPELVTDPAGNIESAVGWMKFMRFARRVVPQWAAE